MYLQMYDSVTMTMAYLLQMGSERREGAAHPSKGSLLSSLITQFLLRIRYHCRVLFYYRAAVHSQVHICTNRFSLQYGKSKFLTNIPGSRIYSNDFVY